MSITHPLRLVIISRFFPPQGGPGVQRALKFAKYLPSVGVQVAIVTEANPKTSNWCPEDSSLLDDLPANTPVIRVKWPSVLSNAHDSSEAAKWVTEVESLVTHYGYNSCPIMVTMSPFEDSIIASRLAASLKTAWIADLRDPWHFDEFRPHRHRIERFLRRKAMHRQLNTAATIIFNTPSAASKYLEFCRINNLSHPHVEHITNGFDESDFNANAKHSARDHFTIVHTGFFHTKEGLRQRKRRILYTVLGSYEPGVNILARSPYYLLKALNTIRQTEPAIYAATRIVFAGQLSEEDRSLIAKAGMTSKIETPGYLPHLKSTALLSEASLLFFPMHGVGKRSRATIIPGKLYEYMASSTPILATVPPGDARDILSQSTEHYITTPGNVDEIARAVISAYRIRSTPPASLPKHKAYLNTYSRKHLAGKLAAIVARCTARTQTHD